MRRRYKEVVPDSLITCFYRVIEALERVIDEGCGVRDAVEVQCESARRGIKGEIDLVGEDGDGLPIAARWNR